MQDILVATPLPLNAASKPYTFSGGVSIRTIDPVVWDHSGVKHSFSYWELEDLTKTQYWLTTSESVDDPNQPDDRVYDRARLAMYAMQLIHPIGCPNVYLKLQPTQQSFNNIGGHHCDEMASTRMGGLAYLEPQGLEADFEAVFKGVSTSFREGIVRLANPVRSLERGLQIDDYALSTLFCVMGLDMLFMAGNRAQFITHINGFIGPSTLIFPRTLYRQMQPKYQVQDVLGYLYKFRNIVAHGAEIPKFPYLQKHDFVDTNGCSFDYEYYSYAELMRESALFILCKALRKVFVDSLIDEVRDESKWKQHLKIGGRLQGAATKT